jgi:hypothetical protein
MEHMSIHGQMRAGFSLMLTTSGYVFLRDLSLGTVGRGIQKVEQNRLD